MDVKDIIKAIRPLKRRIHLNNAFLCWTYAFIFAGVVSLVLSCSALFFPIPFIKDKLLGIYLVVMLAALAVSFFLGPKTLKTIQVGDSLGLKERLVTAFQLQNENTPVAQMQRDDALKAVSSANFKTLYPLRPPVLKISIGFVLLIMVVTTLIIPTGAKGRAILAEDIINEAKNQAKKLDKERKEIKKSSMVSDKKLEEINKKVDELLKDLNKSKNEEDALKALSKAKHELDKLKNSLANQELQKIAQKLSTNKLAKGLSDAMKKGEPEGIKEEIKGLKEKLENAEQKDLEELSESLKEAAQEISDTGLKEDLTALSESIKTENTNSIANNLETLSSDLSKSLQNNPGSLSAMQQSENNSIGQLMDSINSSKYAISKQAGMDLNISQGSGQQSASQSGIGQSGNSQQVASGAQAGQQGGSGQPGNQSGGSQGTQSGQAGQNGQNSQQGQGNQSGSGSGRQGNNSNGSGSQGGKGGGQSGGNGQGGGGGAGNGSSNKDAGYSEGESSGGAKRPGDKKTENYESIYVPKRLGGDSQASQVNGTKNNSGQSQWSEVNNLPIGTGDTVPYNEVYQEYRDEAMSGLDEAQIPSGMKDMVRDYFTTLD